MGEQAEASGFLDWDFATDVNGTTVTATVSGGGGGVTGRICGPITADPDSALNCKQGAVNGTTVTFNGMAAGNYQVHVTCDKVTKTQSVTV